MWFKKQEEWSPGLAVRDIVISLLILMLVFLWDNREYIFQYQFHRDEYTKVEGYVWRTFPRSRSREWVAMYTSDGKWKRRCVVRSFWEGEGNSVLLVYSESRKPSICRAGYALTSHFIFILLFTVVCHIYTFWQGQRKIHRGDSGG